jgi:hypothetical protein
VFLNLRIETTHEEDLLPHQRTVPLGLVVLERPAANPSEPCLRRWRVRWIGKRRRIWIRLELWKR